MILSQLQAGEEYDVLIIGGGATGAGAALDAQMRGLKTACVEREDFACKSFKSFELHSRTVGEFVSLTSVMFYSYSPSFSWNIIKEYKAYLGWQ